MCETMKEYRGDFSLTFKTAEFPNNLKELLNFHVQVQFPGLEYGFFPGLKKSKDYALASMKQFEGGVTAGTAPE